MATQKNSPNPVSRRGFIAGAVAAGAATVIASKLVKAEEAHKDTAPAPAGATKPVILGSGEHTYEWVKGWGTPPGHVKYGNTHGVQVDSQGRVFIHNASEHSVCIYDGDGKFIKSWGKEYAQGAHGLQLKKEGNNEYLYLALTGQHLCVKTTLDGEVVWKLEFPKEWAVYNARFVPTNIAIAANGDVYISDGYGSNFIHQYTNDMKFIRTFGGPGKGPGQLSCPHGIWVDTRSGEEKLLVADRANIRLQYFTMDGKPVSMVTEELRHPCHFDQRNGDLLIPDLRGRVTIFGKDNKLVTHLGDNPDKGQWANNGTPRDKWADGHFIAPHGACWDKDGNIYVAEWVAPGRVTKLKKVNA